MLHLVRDDPLVEFRAFPVNTHWYAVHWLRHGGDVHPQEHWRITERLDPWRRRVTEAGLAGALLDEIGPEVPPEPPAPKQVWAAPTMPTRAAQSPAGEQVEGCRYPNTPPISPQIPECAEAIEATGKSKSSPRRAYHRRAEPRGTGRWAQKCRRRRPGEARLQ